MGKHQKAMIVSTERVAVNTYQMIIETDNAKREAMPGQFLHVQIPNRPDLLMRRPISINSLDTSSSTISLIIQSKGAGTKALCELPQNSILDIIGPIGKGFVMLKDARKVAVIGGGIGVAPLRYLIEQNPNVAFYSLLGFRSKKYSYQIPIFKKLSSLYLHTDDGTAGKKGFATDTLERLMEVEHFDAIYACGPTLMFKSLQKVVAPTTVPCYASLEQRMGCGIGGCKVCVCKIREGTLYDHKKVCQDGPVFDIRKVIL